MPPRNPLIHLARNQDFIRANASRHDKFQAKAPRASGKRYRVQLTLHATSTVRNASVASRVETYLQRAKALLDEHDLDLRVVDFMGTRLAYDTGGLPDPADPTSADLDADRPSDVSFILGKTARPIADQLAAAGVPNDGTWLPIVFTPFRGAAMGVSPVDETKQPRGVCFVESEAPRGNEDQGVVLHEACHASGLSDHTSAVEWDHGPKYNILLTLNDAQGRARNGIDEKTLFSLFEADFCQPPYADGVGCGRVV